MTSEAYIFDSIRSPRGKRKNGSLNEVTPTDLLSKLMISLSDQHNLETSLVDDVVIGCVMPVGDQGANIGKAAAQYAGWDTDVPGMQINRFCGSGLEAINIAAMKIKSGWENLIVSGGVESMSRVPMGTDGGSMVFEPKVSLETNYVPQGIGADLIATIDKLSRSDLDAFALESHKRALEAQRNNKFNSIIPIYDQNGLLILEKDEHIRQESSINELSKLKPSFEFIGKMGYDAVAQEKYPNVEKINHVHTAGNSSGIVDGAALTLIGSKAIGEDLGLKPRAIIRSIATCSTDPTIMLTGPAPATRKALKRAKMKISDVDLIEVNEAFAAVVLRFMKEMNIDNTDNLNVNGGSIAMGHPLGATGSMLMGTLLDELEYRDLTVGLVTLCVAGGMGIATVIERV
ncbi:MAG: acetyl-CoA C-acetyltransferase [Candidatus Neomarinimicrobiota bacterium]|jgi:acetyl-CoA C-acetyltransferase|tara:strand:- start:2386 stop:3591 length:1206 start_codon:yes stop_codon:yes gene_type:complete